MDQPPAPEDRPPPRVLPPLSVGAMLTLSARLYASNAGGFVAIVFVPVLVMSVLGAYVSGTVQPDTSPETAFGVGLAAGLIQTMLWQLAIAAATFAASDALVGARPDVVRAYRVGFAHVWRVLGVSVLVGLAVAIGFMLFIVPGVYLLVRLAVTVPVVVVEQRGVAAIRRSWELTRAHLGRAFGVVAVSTFALLSVSLLFSAVFPQEWYWQGVGQLIAYLITMPFAALVSVILYVDLRSRSEGLDLDRLRAELAAQLDG